MRVSRRRVDVASAWRRSRRCSARPIRTCESAEGRWVNRQSFDNKDGDNIVGIYRFVDKIYSAQIVNYGKRLMLDGQSQRLATVVSQVPTAYSQLWLSQTFCPSIVSRPSCGVLRSNLRCLL
jgi:hypothetical protein